MSRRIHPIQYVLIGVLCGACVYLWSRKIHPHQPIENSNGKSQPSVGEQSKEIFTDYQNNAADDLKEEFGDQQVARGSKEEPVDSNDINTSNNELNPNSDAQEPMANGEQNTNSDDPIDIAAEEDANIVASTTTRAALVLPQTLTDKKVDIVAEENKSPNTDQLTKGIEQLPTIDVSLPTDPNRTLEWLDLWNNDQNCTIYDVRLLPDKSLAPRAFVSFPGSGNTWIRMLIMGLTGVFTNSIYPGDDALFPSQANTSFEVPTDCGCTIFQKTHDFSLDAMLFFLPEANRSHTLEQFHRDGIFLIRNPFDAILSYRNFGTGGMQGVAPATEFEGKGWDNFVARSIVAWEVLAEVWIRGLKRGGVIYYERMKYQMESELRRLNRMLGLTSLNDKRMDCVLRHATDNSFKREHKKNNYPDDPFTASQRLLIHKSIDKVQAILKERGLDPLPVEYYTLYSVIPEYGVSSSS